MVRGKLLALALLVGMLLAACSGGHTSPGRPSSGNAAPAAAPDVPPASFYQVPDPLPPGPPGALIRATRSPGCRCCRAAAPGRSCTTPATSTAMTSPCPG